MKTFFSLPHKGLQFIVSILNQKCFVYILVLIISVNETLTGQVDTYWVNRFNGPDNSTDRANSIAVDSEGSVVVGGTITTVLTSSDFTTIKYNSAGVMEWNRMYNGPGNSIDEIISVAVDRSSVPNNFCVTGRSYGNGTNADFNTIKYNSSGDSLWVRRYNSTTSGNDEAISVKVDNAGFVYVTGNSEGAGTSFDFVTLKYDPSGNMLWTSRYNGPANSSDFVSALCVDGFGNVYVTGFTAGTGFFDYVTIKYNSSGDSLWVKRYNGTGNGNDQSRSIAVDNSGNVYVTGGSPGINSGADYGTIKYSSSGVQSWFQSYVGPGNGSDVAEAIEVSPSGNIYITGHSLGTNSSYDYATIKYNGNGILQWVQRYGGPGSAIDRAFSLAIDQMENVYVNGFSNTVMNYGDYATVKYNSQGTQQWVQMYNGPDNMSDAATGLYADNFGNVYVTGYSNSANTMEDFATIKYTQPDLYELNLNAFIEGFYDSSSDMMIPDTIELVIRNESSPYGIIDSSEGILNSSGSAVIFFSNISQSINFYLVVEHRNSIETWSSSLISFSSGQSSYDFSGNASAAFGSNQIQIDNSPTRFGIYSGDVFRDGFIDLTDITLIYNDAIAFVSGYVQTDITGDFFVDLSDLTRSFNNASNFISIIRP